MNEKGPEAVGVPETELPVTASPPGAPELIAQLYGGLPPEAANVTDG